MKSTKEHRGTHHNHSERLNGQQQESLGTVQ